MDLFGKFLCKRLIILAVLVLYVQVCTAQFADDPLAEIYQRVAEDLQEGKPLIVTSYLAACPSHIYGNGTLENNLYWDFMYGHKTLFDRSHSNEHVKSISPNTKWERILLETRDTDPQRILVYKTTVQPNERWQRADIDTPFTMYHIYLYYLDGNKAMTDLTMNTKAEKATKSGDIEALTIDGRTVNIGVDSHFTGFWGHNLFYDQACIGLEDIKDGVSVAEGVFNVGCNTIRVGGIPKKTIGKNDVGFLFTNSFMAPEGYVAIALLEAISQAESNKELIETCNRAYQYFQRLGGQRAGRLFVPYTE